VKKDLAASIFILHTVSQPREPHRLENLEPRILFFVPWTTTTIRCIMKTDVKDLFIRSLANVQHETFSSLNYSIYPYMPFVYRSIDKKVRLCVSRWVAALCLN